jgi:hypothetical protein
MLGDVANAATTGFNQFGSVDGYFVKNMAPAETVAEYNDWGVYTREEIAARVSGEGGVDFEPWLGKAVAPGTVAVALVDDDTGAHVSDAADPQVTLDSLTQPRDSASNLFLFVEISPGTYTAEGTADGYDPDSDIFRLSGGEIVAVELQLKYSGSEGEGEGEGEGTGPQCFGGALGRGGRGGPRSSGGDLVVLGAVVGLFAVASRRGRGLRQVM